MKTRLKDFTYTKKPGDVSNRHVFVISKPSDCYFAIDLSEFDGKDLEFYEAELEAIYEWLEGRIEDMGLGSNYRLFKEDKMG